MEQLSNNNQTTNKMQLYSEMQKIYVNRPTETLKRLFTAGQGRLFWLSPLRSDVSQNGQAGGGTSKEAANYAQS